MEQAKLFTNGGSQAVRLPKDCRFEGDTVMTNRIGNIVILMPKDDPWRAMLDSIPMFTKDFLSQEIEELPLEARNF